VPESRIDAASALESRLAAESSTVLESNAVLESGELPESDGAVESDSTVESGGAPSEVVPESGRGLTEDESGKSDESIERADMPSLALASCTDPWAPSDPESSALDSLLAELHPPEARPRPSRNTETSLRLRILTSGLVLPWIICSAQGFPDRAARDANARYRPVGNAAKYCRASSEAKRGSWRATAASMESAETSSDKGLFG
jgi:hypothetical protein